MALLCRFTDDHGYDHKDRRFSLSLSFFHGVETFVREGAAIALSFRRSSTRGMMAHESTVLVSVWLIEIQKGIDIRYPLSAATRERIIIRRAVFIGRLSCANVIPRDKTPNRPLSLTSPPPPPPSPPVLDIISGIGSNYVSYRIKSIIARSSATERREKYNH